MSFDQHFAAAFKLERDGRYDDAFIAYAEGNRQQRATLAPEALEAMEIATLEQVTRQFSESFQRQIHDTASSSSAPILIVGLPNTGAALIERILAQHPSVQAMGETGVLHEAIDGHYPISLFSPNPPGHFRARAEAYLDGMRAAGWRTRPRFVDRQLQNRWMLGAVRMLFPRATIIHAVRNPLDVCVSTYTKSYRKDHDLACDLGDIGRQYLRYRQLMDHWARTMPGKIVHVKHEGLVTNLEASVREMLKACDLGWSDSCLHYATSGPTAPPAQSLEEESGRWRRFEAHLRPLYEILEPYLAESGVKLVKSEPLAAAESQPR
jgi:hypothetical protein